MKKISSRNNLTRNEICKNIKNNYGLSIPYAKIFLDNLFDIIILEIKKKKSFSVKNFGTFKLNIKKSRTGRNPKTMQTFLIKARKTVTFKPSKNLSLRIKK